MRAIEYGLAGWLLVEALAGCAVRPPVPPSDPAAVRCLVGYAELDAAVANRGTTPSAPARIAGFPHLRVDRFLARYREQPPGSAETAAWLARFGQLDREARRVEWDSLPAAARAELNRRSAG